MKMKFYVRGLGVGFVLSALIFVIAFSFYKPSYSKEEIKNMAEKEGYKVTDPDSTLDESKTDKSSKTDTKKATDSSKSDKKTTDDSSKSAATTTTDNSKSDAKTNTDTSKTLQESEDDKKTASAADNTTTTADANGNTTTTTEVAPEDVQKNNIRIDVEKGASDSLAIANDLASMGVVDNGKSFDNFMNENGYSRRIQPGTFEFHKGMTYNEVANILTHKN
jgi:cytoskeletal protein RodZ